MAKPIDQETTSLERQLIILTDPKRKGHATPWGDTQGSTRVSHRPVRVREKCGQELYCGFQGKDQARQGKQA